MSRQIKYECFLTNSNIELHTYPHKNNLNLSTNLRYPEQTSLPNMAPLLQHVPKKKARNLEKLLTQSSIDLVVQNNIQLEL